MLAEYKEPGPTLNSEMRLRVALGEGMADLGGDEGAKFEGEPYEGGGDWGRLLREVDRCGKKLAAE